MFGIAKLAAFAPPLAQMRLPLGNIFEKDTTPVSYSAGSVIFNEGQKRDCMYVVKAGEVYLLVRGQLGETVSVDGFFGELAMIDNSPRTATAVAQNRLYTNPHQRETIPVSSSRGSALRPRYHALDGPQNPTPNRTIRRDAMAWTAASPKMIVFKAIVRFLDHANGRIARYGDGAQAQV